MFPVVCFTCGKIIGNKYEAYCVALLRGEEPGDVLTKLSMKRYCCRRMFLTHVEIDD